MLKQQTTRLKKFKELLGPEVWRLFQISLVTGILWFVIEAAFILVLQGFLAAIGVTERSKLTLPAWYPQSIRASVFILIVFGSVRACVAIAREYSSNRSTQVFLRRHRRKMLHFAFHNASSFPHFQIVSIFNERISDTARMMQQVSILISTFTSAMLFLVLGFKLAPLELLVGLTVLGLAMLPFRFMSAKFKVYGQGLVDVAFRISEILMRGLKNNFFLKLYERIPHELNQGYEAFARYESINRKYHFLTAFKGAYPAFVGILVISLVTYVSLTWLHTPGATLLSFFYIFIRLSQSVSEANNCISSLVISMPGFKTFYDWYLMHEAQVSSLEYQEKSAEPLEVKSAFEAAVAQNGVTISAQQLAFSFTKTRPLFSDLSFTVKRGDILVIQGSSGVGKSTLLTLILGHNKPGSGRVTVNGFEATVIRTLLSEQIAYVGPESYIISGSIRDNLLYGHTAPATITEDAIWSALKKAQVAEDVRRLPRGLEDNLNDNPKLSTGQQQRLAIARAILRSPKLLILDEATANLDPATEKKFIGDLQGILGGMTTVIISHKDSFNAIATQRLALGHDKSLSS